MPFCLAGMVYTLFLTGLPVGATVIIGVLIVVAATVNEGVLLLTFAEELRQHDNLTPLQTVINSAKIRLRPRLMIALAIIFGFIPPALNLEKGGEIFQPMAVGAIGGLTLGILVALFMMPCLYVIFVGKRQGRSSSSTLPETNHRSSYLAMFDNCHLTRKNSRYFLDSEMGLWWGAITTKLKRKPVG